MSHAHTLFNSTIIIISMMYIKDLYLYSNETLCRLLVEISRDLYVFAKKIDVSGILNLARFCVVSVRYVAKNQNSPVLCDVQCAGTAARAVNTH